MCENPLSHEGEHLHFSNYSSRAEWPAQFFCSVYKIATKCQANSARLSHMDIIIGFSRFLGRTPLLTQLVISPPNRTPDIKGRGGAAGKKKRPQLAVGASALDVAKMGEPTGSTRRASETTS
jgi:hypothetical protein